MVGVLDRLQRGLEHLYRVDTDLAIADYVIDADTRGAVPLARRPREQLLLCERDGVLEMALYIDGDALANLQRRDPSRALDDRNLGDFLLAVEGVSHFVYAAVRARRDQSVSGLELELQAEIDKYVTCLLSSTAPDSSQSVSWRRRLYGQFSYLDDLDADERERYRAANANARRYTGWLERRYVRDRRIGDMLAELRRFYRMPLSAKLGAIACAA